MAFVLDGVETLEQRNTHCPVLFLSTVAGLNRASTGPMESGFALHRRHDLRTPKELLVPRALVLTHPEHVGHFHHDPAILGRVHAYALFAFSSHAEARSFAISLEELDAFEVSYNIVNICMTIANIPVAPVDSNM